ncbi:MAG TPA: hypothetical protein VI233_05345 [Puia sp.]
MDEIIKRIAGLKTKDEFIDLVRLLAKDLMDNEKEWENNNLHSYLESIADWTEDMEGYYQNTGQSLPSDIPWKIFADILIAAKMYE